MSVLFAVIFANIELTDDILLDVNKQVNYIKIPKFFKSLLHIELVDVDTKTVINPIDYSEEATYYYFEFLNDKRVSSTSKIRII